MSSSHRSHRHHLKCCMSCMFSASLEWMLDTNWAWAWVRNPLTFGFRCISLTEHRTEQRTEQRLSHSVTRVARFHLHGTLPVSSLSHPLTLTTRPTKKTAHKQQWRQIADTCTCTKCAVVSVNAEGSFCPTSGYVRMCRDWNDFPWCQLIHCCTGLHTSSFILFSYFYVFVPLSIFFYHM